MLTLLAAIADAARQRRGDYYTGLTTRHADLLEAAERSLTRTGGVAVVHDHEHITTDCAPRCQLVPAPPPTINDPHRR